MQEKERIILVFFVLGMCIACILWMYKPGIHFIPGFMHADVRENAYLYDAGKEAFLGETEVMIKGSGNNITKKFKGEISVSGYELEGGKPDSVPIDKEGSIWKVMYAGFGKMGKDEDGTERWEAAISDISYYLQLDVRDSDNFVVSILDSNPPGSSLFVISADTEEKAKEVFQSIVLKEAAAAEDF